MADYDEKSRSESVVMVAPATVTSTPTATGIDLLDFGACTVSMFVGAGGITFTTTNKIEFFAYESDDNSTYSLCADDALILDVTATAPGGTGLVRSITAAKASADTTIPTVGYRGKKRYFKVIPTLGGTHSTGTLIGVTARRGYAYHGPISASSIET